MSKQNSGGNYQKLGVRLRSLRDEAGETLAETSGSVEIDVQDLASFELGRRRPAEDVLLLLISHFEVSDEEALKLWETAGYGLTKLPLAHLSTEPQAEAAPSEKQVLFTDVVDVTVNNYGVVMNFMQNGGPGSTPSTVARVGMSREHAKSILKILQVTLAQTERSSSDRITPNNESI